MREPVGRVPPLGYHRVQQAWTKVAHLAKVTGGRDCKTFLLALTHHLVSICPRVLEYAVCLFLIPFFPFARWSVVSWKLRGNLLRFLTSLSLLVSFCLQSLFSVSACGKRVLTRTVLHSVEESKASKTGRVRRDSHRRQHSSGALFRLRAQRLTPKPPHWRAGSLLANFSSSHCALRSPNGPSETSPFCATPYGRFGPRDGR